MHSNNTEMFWGAAFTVLLLELQQLVETLHKGSVWSLSWLDNFPVVHQEGSHGMQFQYHATEWNSLWKSSPLLTSRSYTLLKFSITSDSNFLFTGSFYVYKLTVSVVHCKILLQSSGYKTVRSLGKMGACCVEEHQMGWCLLSRISSHEVASPDSLWYSPHSVKPALLGKNIIVLELNEPWLKGLLMEEREVQGPGQWLL